MIKLTIQQLLNAASSGAAGRFFACNLTIMAWRANRKTAKAFDEELKIFQAKRDEIMAKHEAVVDAKLPSQLQFPDKEKAATFAAEWGELMALEIEVPGEPLKMVDIVDGQLAQADDENLAPFFVD